MVTSIVDNDQAVPATGICANQQYNERKEVLLDQGDGMLDAGNLTKCKNAVCYIYCNSEDSVRRGTGFFATLKIADTEHHVIVTNNHVINNKEDAANAVARFHYEGNLPGADARLMPDVLFYTEEVLDYTIIGCDHDLIQHNFCIDPIEFQNEENINIGDDIFIFQHPKGETKKFSYEKISNIGRPFVYYNADTDIGSSGSVVLRKFKPIAIHCKGSDSLRYNKGTLCSEILNHLNYGTYTTPKPVTESADQLKRRLSEQGDNQRNRDTPMTPSPSKKYCTVDLTLSAQPSEETLEELSKDIATYWKHLGRKLKVPNSKIEMIHKDHINYDDIAEKAFQMLLAWKDGGGSCATNQVLKDALIAYGKVDTARKHFS
ncbi:uncharacterized protein LOC130641836 [Hydractinia symbiolongicarpus]|uniref:uncharacterized protein LOC130641836 n=1 Tax=Hydractinia symbiolongicarpus TaxID=13093 RepID=UPI002550762F|nr:uncharacterized protein LOC130641836 [Hydractinia symbiolongicarpus]